MVKRLAEVTGAKVIAVGDDWQSIFAFSGSDITLFTKFLKLMGYGRELQITHTYRNSQELIDIAGGFVQKNPTQIKKRLISSKHIKNPIIVKTYDDMSNIMSNKTNTIVETIGEIIAKTGVVKHSENNSLKIVCPSILIIGRYNFDEYYLLQEGSFTKLSGGKLKCTKYPDADITYMTAHSSKGLGYDYVILINAIEGKFGFPSQIDDDPVMKLVTVEDRSMSFAEERRLFYVALTRTKNRIYIVAPENKPSRFVQELIKDWGVECPPKLKMNIHSVGKEKRIKISNKHESRCPVCGFPLMHKYNKNIGLELWICTNEPEICDFMTNDKDTMSNILDCPVCMDGYMIVKKNRNNVNKFLGCTNYRLDGAGCNHVEYIPEQSK